MIIVHLMDINIIIEDKNSYFCHLIMRIFLNLQYDGTNYHGWQKQPNGITVQEVIEKALSTLYRTQIDTTGCGRTDTGVHSHDFYLHYDIEEDIIPADELLYRLNAILPEDIKIIRKLRPVNDEVNARFDAVSRTYRYIISTEKAPFLTKYSYQYHYSLDINLMNQAAETLKEYTDFKCFSKTGTQVFTNNCKIYDAHWEKKDYLLYFYITADRFLRNMVRSIVGTLLMVGNGKITLQQFREIIESKDRCKAGESVPAQGLSLIHVEYGEKLSTV